jgi:hypothetical protein
MHEAIMGTFNAKSGFNGLKPVVPVGLDLWKMNMQAIYS